MGIKEVISIAEPLIKRFEGWRSKPYLCSANVPTIGWGSTMYENGDKVTLDDPEITKERGQALFELDAERFLLQVYKACPVLTKHDNKAAAILSWTYNLGPARLRSSTMRTRINQERWEEAAQELKRWNLAAGKVTRGLILRREAEASLFLSPTNNKAKDSNVNKDEEPFEKSLVSVLVSYDKIIRIADTQHKP
jgi:lysozyme